MLDAICKQWETSFAHSSEVWSSNSLIHGAHVLSRDDLEFDLAVVQIRGLKQWLTQATPSSGGWINGLDGRDEADSLGVALPGARLSLFVAPVDRTHDGERFRPRVATAQFALDEQTSLSVFRELYVEPLRELLVFATRESAAVESLTAILPLTEPTVPGPPFPPGKVISGHRPSVSVVERVRTAWPPERRREYEKMLFGVATLHEDPSGLIGRWFENRARLRDAGAFFFGTLDGPATTLHGALFNLMNFAEAYHRTEHDELPLPPEVHQELVERMLATLDGQDQRDVYSNRLDHANSLTQRWRIERLVGRAIGAVPELDTLRTSLSRALAHTRNWVTHWTQRTDYVLEGEGLADGVRQLVLVLQANLMLDLGLPRETVAACIRNSYSREPILPAETPGAMHPLAPSS